MTTYSQCPSASRRGEVRFSYIGVRSFPVPFDEIVQLPSYEVSRSSFSQEDEPIVQEPTAASIISESIALVIGTEAVALSFVPMVLANPFLPAPSSKVGGLSPHLLRWRLWF